MRQIASFVGTLIHEGTGAIDEVKEQVLAMCAQYPCMTIA